MSAYRNSQLAHNFPSAPLSGTLIEDLVATVDRVVNLPRPPEVIASLTPTIEWIRFCYSCNSDQRFVADRACVSGLIGCCSGCGDERIAPFTRSNSEAS
jgi:hypothetical protein